MALNLPDRKAWQRVWKRRRKLERRQRRMEKALRWNLYVDPLAKLVGSITRLFRPR